MPRVIARYLGRELLQHWLGVTLVLWLILVSARFSLYLGQAAGGRLPAETVLALLGFKSVGFVVFLLPLSLFLALLLVLGRWNRDRETVALAAAGFGPAGYVRVLALPVLAATLLTAVLTLFVVPETARQGYALRAQAVEAAQTRALAAGRFLPLRGGELLLFGERAGADGRSLEDVFVLSGQGRRRRLVAAARAEQRLDPGSGDRFVVLQDGYRYDGEPGRADFRILRFDEYAVRIRRAVPEPAFKWDAVPTARLQGMHQPQALAEWQQRLSRPLSMPLLALVAVALGGARPGAGRYTSLLAGVLFFIVYFNLQAALQLWVGRGQLPAWPGMGWAHLLPLLTAALVLAGRRRRLRRGAAA